MTVTLESIDKERLRGLLLRNWMTHDAMWFANAVQSLGIARANALNRAAVRGMAGVEAKRLCKLLGVTSVATPGELRRFFDAAIALVIPDFMAFTWEWSEDGRALCFEVTRCFAHDGVTMLGVVGDYECGIYERIYGWLDALGVRHEVTPDAVHCTLHHAGECVRRLRIDFPEAAAG